MNINTANLKVGAAASTDELRKNIQTIHFTKNHTEATNGHILARVSLPFQYDAKDLPANCQTEPAENITPFSVMAKAAMSIRPLKQKGKWGIVPCLDGQLYVDVNATNQNGTAEFTSTDTETSINPKLQKLDTDFPELDRAIPKETPDFKTRFNIGYLETLLAIAKSTGSEFIDISTFGTQGKPALLETEANGQKFTGIIMPVRT